MIIQNRIITKYYLMDENEPNIIRGAMNADLEEMKAALANDPTCINETDDKMHLTAMHIAAANGCYWMVDFLCQQPGYDINLKDAVGRTPYYLARVLGCHDIINRLYEDTHVEIERLLALDEDGDDAQAEANPEAGNVTVLHPKPPTVF